MGKREAAKLLELTCLTVVIPLYSTVPRPPCTGQNLFSKNLFFPQISKKGARANENQNIKLFCPYYYFCFLFQYVRRDGGLLVFFIIFFYFLLRTVHGTFRTPTFFNSLFCLSLCFSPLVFTIANIVYCLCARSMAKGRPPPTRFCTAGSSPCPCAPRLSLIYLFFPSTFFLYWVTTRHGKAYITPDNFYPFVNDQPDIVADQRPKGCAYFFPLYV